MYQQRCCCCNFDISGNLSILLCQHILTEVSVIPVIPVYINDSNSSTIFGYQISRSEEALLIACLIYVNHHGMLCSCFVPLVVVLKLSVM